MLTAIDTYFFERGSAYRLGVCRALFYSFYLLQCFLYDPFQYIEMPSEFWRPPHLISFLPPATEMSMNVAVWVLSISAIVAAFGFRSRVSSAIAALSGCYVFGVINAYGIVKFHFCPMQMIAFILPFAPTGERFSVDAWIRDRGVLRDIRAGRFQWPVRLSQVVFIVLMFTAGIQKVTGNWLIQPASNMRDFLRYKYYVHGKYKGEPLPEFILTISEYWWLMLGLGTAMVIVEFTCPIALNVRWRKIRFFYIFSLFLMQAILAFVLNTLPAFPWLCVYFFFVPWEILLPEKLRAHEVTRVSR